MKLDLSLDYHAHILPGCDHGSDGLATSLKQVEMAASAGVKTICATPHFYPHKESVESFLRRRKKTAGLLLRELPENAPLIQLGAEVLICDGMERLDGLNRLCREGTNELLLEMPFYAWPESIWDTLYLLCDLADIQIVLAHAERYPAENIEKLICESVPLQLNAECLTKPLKRKRYLEWIENGYVKYLGSDIHMLGRGYKDWQKCRQILVDIMQFTNITLILSASGKTKTLMLLSGGSIVLNIGMNFLLFHLLGVIGPAIATLLITSLTGAAILYFSAKKLGTRITGFFDFRYLIRLLAENIAAVTVLACLRNLLESAGLNNLLILLLICGTYYVILLALNKKRLIVNLKEIG